MNCDICGRHYHARRLPFLCAVDVRNRLYELRVAHAAVLLQSEGLEQRVNAALAAADAVEVSSVGEISEAGKADKADMADKAGESVDTTTGTADAAVAVAAASRCQLDAWASEQKAALDRAADATTRAAQLRQEMAETRAALEQRRTQLRQRRSDLAARTNGTAARRARVQAEAERSMAMTRYKWNQSYDAMAATRAFLCMEAAKLYGLRCVKKGGDGGVRYELGGFEVVDPAHMNALPPEVVSTSLAHVTHILVLACYYLAIRLPAEITLPHPDYPRPTVFSLSSSYGHADVPFPGSAADFSPPLPLLSPLSPRHAVALKGSGRSSRSSRSSHSASTGASGSAAAQRPLPRARPLFIDKPLPQLAKDDSTAHTMFLEAVALLAYNIAWACLSQGVPLGDKASLDDVFCIGRNLYNLLIGNQLLHSHPARIFSAAAAAAAPGPAASPPRGGGADAGVGGSTTGGSNASTPSTLPPPFMGRYSHGTAHTFLADGIVQAFKLPSPNRLADRLRTKLSSDAAMPDWELLEDDAWAVEDEDQHRMEDGVLNRVVTVPSIRSGDAATTGPRAGPTIVVGSRVPEKRLYGVESMASVVSALEESLRHGGSSTHNGLGNGPASAFENGAADPPSSSRPADRPRGSGTSGWTKLRNR